MELRLDSLKIRETNTYAGGDRLFIDVPKSKKFDALTNKERLKLVRPLFPTILRMLNLPQDTKVSFSKHAGCTMCPCSPGFILRGVENGCDIWASFTEVRS